MSSSSPIPFLCGCWTAPCGNSERKTRTRGGAKWRVHHRARQRKLAGDDIVMLTIGEPDVDAPAEVVDATVASLQGGATGYTPGRGMPNFLDALARHYSQRTGRTIDPSQIMALPGTQAGLFVAMVVVPTPPFGLNTATTRRARARPSRARSPSPVKVTCSRASSSSRFGAAPPCWHRCR